MSKKVRVIVDLPNELYVKIRELAGGSQNVSTYVHKELQDKLRTKNKAQVSSPS